MSRLSDTFDRARKEGRTALICYLMAGVPSPETFLVMVEPLLQARETVER